MIRTAHSEYAPADQAWSAYEVGGDEETIGRGPTAEAAIADLHELMEVPVMSPQAGKEARETEQAPKLFLTTVLGIGPYCVEYADGEIVHTRSEDRQHLFAAAHELLEALKTTAGNIRSLGPAGALGSVPMEYERWLAVVDAAIAKAVRS